MNATHSSGTDAGGLGINNIQLIDGEIVSRRSDWAVEKPRARGSLAGGFAWEQVGFQRDWTDYPGSSEMALALVRRDGCGSMKLTMIN